MLTLGSIIRVFGFYGALTGAVSALLYVLGAGDDRTLFTIAVVCLGAPIAQAMIFGVLAVLGYPLYKYAVKARFIQPAVNAKD